MTARSAPSTSDETRTSQRPASPDPETATPSMKEDGVRRSDGANADADAEKTIGDSSSSGAEAVGSPAPAPPAPPTKKSFSFHMSMTALAMIVFVVSWDATSLAVAIPVIASQLNATTFESFWASISFMLGVAITQPIYASVSNVVGRKGPLYVAMLLFGVGCVVFAVAGNMPMVIGGRVLQGLGGGGLDVLESVILSDITSLRERGLYMGLMAIPIAVGTILGPIVGSLFAEYVSWRWIGWVNLPFVAVAFALSFFFLRLRPLEAGAATKLRRLDWGGMVLFTVAATSFVLPLSWADALYSWNSWRTILPLVIGVLVFVAFALYEKLPVEAMFPYRIFATMTARMALLGGFINGAILYTILLYLPLFFEAVYLKTPLIAAVQILPMCCAFVGFSVIAPVSVQILGRYRMQLLAGWVLQTLFLGLLCILERDSRLAIADTLQVFLGAGLGIIFMTTNLPLQAAVTSHNVDDAGLAAGLLVVFRLFGALVGLAVGSSVFNSVFAKSIAAVGPLPDALAALRDATQAVGFIPSLRAIEGVSDDTMHAVIDAYRVTFRAVWITMTCMSGVGSISAVLLRSHDMNRDDMGRQQLEN